MEDREEMEELMSAETLRTGTWYPSWTGILPQGSPQSIYSMTDESIASHLQRSVF